MRDIRVHGKRLTYDCSRNGERSPNLTLVLLHGSGGDREDWQAQVSGIGDGLSVVALDLPGHGASDAPGERSVAEYAAWVDEFVEALALERVMVAGCSLGSAIALWLAVDPKPWLKAIGIVGGGARLRVHPTFLDGLLSDAPKAAGDLTEYCLSPGVDEDLRRKVSEKLVKAAPEPLHGDLSACNEFDIMDRLGKITVPAWIAVGEHDRLTPPKYATFLATALPGAALCVFPECGHLSMLEQPELFNREIVEFISGLVKTDSR
jgi:pimeloyl-ACP methyl ester carboxylesterase